MLLIYFQKNASFDGFFLSVIIKTQERKKKKKERRIRRIRSRKKILERHPKIVSAFPSKLHITGQRIQTTRSFLPLSSPSKKSKKKKKKEQRIHKARNLEKPPVSRKTYIPRVIEQLSRNSGENRRNTDASFESGPGINLYSARSPIPSRNNKDNSDRARQPVYKVSLSSPLSLPPRFANERDLNASRVRFSGGI